MDIPVEESIKRRTSRSDDRIEKEGTDFLKNVSLGFQVLSEDNRWKKISALNSQQEIISEIKYEIKKLLNNK